MSSVQRDSSGAIRRLQPIVARVFVFAILCGFASAIRPVTAAWGQGDQRSGTLSGSALPESASLEQATQLQREADADIDGRHFREALEKTERALAARRSLLGGQHPDVAYSISRLGLIAYHQGQYERAEALFGDALRMREATLGPNHVDVGESLSDLAAIRLLRGDYVQPETQYQRALAIFRKVPPNSRTSSGADLVTLTGDAENNLGLLFARRGDYQRAETHYSNAIEIRQRARGADDSGVADALVNLGGVFYASKQLDKAVVVLRRGLDIQERGRLRNSQLLATTSSTLAAVYFDQGEYQQAQQLFERALALDREVLDPQHPRIATRLLGLAEVLRLQGEYERADPLYDQALIIREAALGATHPDVATIIVRRALLNYAIGNFDAATALLTRASELREETLALMLKAGSEDQKRLFLGTLVDETDIAVALHLSGAKSLPAARLALTNIVQRKGRSIDAMAEQMANVRRHLDGADENLLEQLVRSQSRLAAAVLKGIATDEQKAAAATLRNDIRQLESTISARSSEFRVASRSVNLGEIQNALPVRTALIEFVSHRPFFVENARESAFGAPRYAAYVLQQDGAITGVELAEMAVIDRHVARFRQALSNPGDRGLLSAARTLYDDLMTPLQSWLQDADRLIISPDGALNLFPFAALVAGDERYLVERFTISYVTSGRDLLRFAELRPNVSDSFAAPAIIANPVFGPRSAGSVPIPDASARSRGFDVRLLDQIRGFEALPGTAQEAAALARELPGARVYTGRDATEALIKQLRSPSILHIATHGFFLRPGPVRSVRMSNGAPSSVSSAAAPTIDRDEAAILSGLALAGANQRRSGEGEDGILTALEMAGLDLWGTRLVVLSACETGLGDPRIGEGVYGLRRALVLAGSESQLVSLWKVSDSVTRDLMIRYYRRLRAGEGRAAALRTVQLAMLRHPSEAHPFYWAGFIESGDWRPILE